MKELNLTENLYNCKFCKSEFTEYEISKSVEQSRLNLATGNIEIIESSSYCCPKCKKELIKII
jgi:ribosomal protein L37AE/L43A